MPGCSKCNGDLICPKCGPEVKIGSSSQPCPLKKGALWIQVNDDLGGGVQGVNVTGAGSSKPTDPTGFASWDPVDSGPYQAKIEALSNTLKDKYILPAATTSAATVNDGEIAFVPFVVTRKASLKVLVFEKGKPEKLFGAATVTAAGDAPLGDKPTSGGTGLADYGKVAPGKLKITAKLAEADAKDYFCPVDPVEVTLAPGEERTVEILAELKNVVTPKVEVEYKLILLSNTAKDQQEADKEELIETSPTRIELSFDQTNSAYPFEKGGTLDCGGKADIYTAETCKPAEKSDGKLTKEQLKAGEKLKLWLKGTSAGKFKVKLTLNDPADPRVKLGEKNPAEEEMGVAKLELKLHEFKKLDVEALEVDPDVDPIATYHTNLKDKKLPDQDVMSAADRVKRGRILHVQDAGHFGRAKIICAKLDAAHLPDGVDDYDVVLSSRAGRIAKGGSDSASPNSGSIAIFDKETEGAKQDPCKVKISDLKADEKTFWVEGSSETDEWRDIRLDMGIDRAEGGLAKTAKFSGDWVRFTVVKIKEVVIDNDPVQKGWDSGTNRFYVNLKQGEDGKKVKVGVRLTKGLKDVHVHVMLAEHADNRKTANWGVDMPTTWNWKDIKPIVKHLDKSNRKKVIHLSEKTDDKGYAKVEVQFSRIGGDKFTPSAYLDQDPHLSKYIDGHTDLSKRKPVQAAAPIEVWRKFWFEAVKVA